MICVTCNMWLPIPHAKYCSTKGNRLAFATDTNSYYSSFSKLLMVMEHCIEYTLIFAEYLSFEGGS